MKLAAASFVLLLLYVHCTQESDEVLGQPLSTFRDDSQGLFGYALFAALLVVGALYVKALARFQREAESYISKIGVVILFVVALTPSTNGFHLVFSLLLFCLLFGYYGVLLYRARPILLTLHLMVPLALAFVVQFHSYGLWQKSFITYFVFLAAVHHHVLTHPQPGGALSFAPNSLRRGQSMKRRKVYRLAQPKNGSRSECK